MLKPRCAWIVANPSACAECALNPRNARAADAEATAPVRHLFYLKALQSAGAVFHYRDLTPDEWKGLIVLNSEQRAHEAEEWEKKRRK